MDRGLGLNQRHRGYKWAGFQKHSAFSIDEDRWARMTGNWRAKTISAARLVRNKGSIPHELAIEL
jgi:hypothetical protein